MIGSCKSCGKVHWYPRAICPHCFSDKTELKEAKGTGEIYTFSVMKRSKIPYAIAYVQLDEGPKMMTNIVDTDLDAIKIGQTGEGRLQGNRRRPAGADVHAGVAD